MKYQVTVTRTETREKTFTIFANSPEAARRCAVEVAGGYDFSNAVCNDAEYDVTAMIDEGGVEVPKSEFVI